MEQAAPVATEAPVGFVVETPGVLAYETQGPLADEVAVTPIGGFDEPVKPLVTEGTGNISSEGALTDLYLEYLPGTGGYITLNLGSMSNPDFIPVPVEASTYELGYIQGAFANTSLDGFAGTERLTLSGVIYKVARTEPLPTGAYRFWLEVAP